LNFSPNTILGVFHAPKYLNAYISYTSILSEVVHLLVELTEFDTIGGMKFNEGADLSKAIQNEGNFSSLENLNYNESIKNIVINPEEVLKEGLDDKGNIKNCISQIRKVVLQKLPEKNKSEFLSDEDDSWGWINIQIQIDLAKSLNINNKDIENIELISFIGDLESFLFKYGEGDFGGNDQVIDMLVSKIKDVDTPILQKIYLKYTLEKLSNLNSGRLGNFSDIKEDFVLPPNYLEVRNFTLNNDQIRTIINDSHNQSYNEADLGQAIHQYDNLGSGWSVGDYVNKLLAPDIIGIYTLMGKLVGWQKIEDLDKEGEDGVVKDFFEIKKECALNSKEDLALFKVSSSLFFRDYLQKSLDVELSKITLENQFYFLNFIQGKNETELYRFREFIKNSKNEEEKVNKLKTFLSIEQGDKEMGHKILNLGEKLPEDVAQKVFSKYGEIIDTADNAEEEVKKLYANDNIPSNVFISIKETLLKKGSSLLSGLANELSNYEKIDEVEILKTLEDIKTSTIIMGKSYLELYKQGIKVPVEEIKDVCVEKISAGNLNDDEKKELLSVYEKGRPKETYENKAHIKLLKDEFEQTLNSKETFVFNIRFGGDIVTFATFNKENNDTLHIGGLTFIDDIRNPAIGEAVMNSIMDEFGNYNIKALVHSENKVLKMYQNRFGFKITKELPREENAGELYFEIERFKEKRIEQSQELKEVA
jgi:hypothetical protein